MDVLSAGTSRQPLMRGGKVVRSAPFGVCIQPRSSSCRLNMWGLYDGLPSASSSGTEASTTSSSSSTSTTIPAGSASPPAPPTTSTGASFALKFLNAANVRKKAAGLPLPRAIAVPKAKPPPTPASASASSAAKKEPPKIIHVEVAVPKATVADDAYPDDVVEEYDPTIPNELDESAPVRHLSKAEIEENYNRLYDDLMGSGGGGDFAARMMKKMGWQEGKGLGKAEQGITTALEVQKTGTKSGRIVSTSEARDPTPAKKLRIDATPVLLLTNMVGRGEVDEDLKRETKEECARFGRVRRVTIAEIPNAPDEEAVRIYVHFANKEDAERAQEELNGRLFAGRKVKASFYDLDRFEAEFPQ